MAAPYSDPDKFQAAAPYPFLFAWLILLIFGRVRFRSTHCSSAGAGPE
jgi:hypothetical protein